MAKPRKQYKLKIKYDFVKIIIDNKTIYKLEFICKKYIKDVILQNKLFFHSLISQLYHEFLKILT